jgi:hypothetical protein
VSGLAKTTVAVGGCPASRRPSTSNSDAGHPAGNGFVNEIVKEGTRTRVLRWFLNMTGRREGGAPGKSEPFMTAVAHTSPPSQPEPEWASPDLLPTEPAADAPTALTNADTASNMAEFRLGVIDGPGDRQTHGGLHAVSPDRLVGGERGGIPEQDRRRVPRGAGALARPPRPRRWSAGRSSARG